MKNNKTLAIVICYNGDDLLKDNLNALIKQTEKIVLVDNGSSANLDYIFEFCKNNNIQVIKNQNNLGIAKALNIGINSQNLNEFSYILTMDQDSILLPNCVSNMKLTLNLTKNIVSCGPSFCDISKIEDKMVLISSGNLFLTDIFKKVNGFNDDLFIDSVDFDFSLKIKEKGYKIVTVPNAKMKHKLGDRKTGTFIFFKKKIIEHNPSRYYYMYRNHRYIVKKYFKKFPLFCIKKIIHSNLHLLELIFFHSNKKMKLKAILKGIHDSKLFIKEQRIKENW